MKYIDIRVSANCEEDMASFLRLCSVIQGAGEKGEGRNIKIFVDGDGSGRYCFYQIDKNGETGDMFPFSPAIENTLWLGE